MENAKRYYDPETGRFNRAAIMRDAWDGLQRSNIRERLSLRLSVVWAYAKSEQLDTQQDSSERKARHLRTSAKIIQLKSRMTDTDHDRVRALTAAAASLTRAA